MPSSTAITRSSTTRTSRSTTRASSAARSPSGASSRFTVLLSHWHLDHVAGNAVFSDCEIIANERTAAHLAQHKQAIETGTYDGMPAIAPLILPTRTFSELELEIGDVRLNLIEANIHSDDATVIWLAERRLLLAGDTMEDTVTYVVEPEGFAAHLADLDRLWALEPDRILPNHGDPGIIAAGGYGKSLVRATQQYIRALQRCADDPALREASLREVIAGPLQAGWINYFAPYEDVHRRNVAMTLAPAAPVGCRGASNRAVSGKSSCPCTHRRARRLTCNPRGRLCGVVSHCRNSPASLKANH